MRKNGSGTASSVTYTPESEFLPYLSFSEDRMFLFISESFEVASRMNVLIQNKFQKGARKK